MWVTDRHESRAFRARRRQPGDNVLVMKEAEPARSVRQLIVESAVRQMGERGYHGTSMRDIAEGAQITVASIYHHFASKQAILQHIMVGALEDTIAMTRGAVLRAGARPLDQLQAIMRVWTVFHATSRDQAIVTATELRSLDTEGRRVVITLRDQQEQIFREVVQYGVDEGVFLTKLPTDATRWIISTGQQASTWFRPDGPLTAAELADRYAILAAAIVEAVH